jgi:hypothetical protein
LNLDSFFLYKGVWNGEIEEKSVAATDTSAQLENLRPAVTYHVRVFAENRLGPGEPSDVIQFTTDEEGTITRAA